MILARTEWLYCPKGPNHCTLDVLEDITALVAYVLCMRLTCPEKDECWVCTKYCCIWELKNWKKSNKILKKLNVIPNSTEPLDNMTVCTFTCFEVIMWRMRGVIVLNGLYYQIDLKWSCFHSFCNFFITNDYQVKRRTPEIWWKIHTGAKPHDESWDDTGGTSFLLYHNNVEPNNKFIISSV